MKEVLDFKNIYILIIALYNYIILYQRLTDKQLSINFILSFLFMITETIWTSCIKDTSYFFKLSIQKGHTTWIQFYMNIIFLNILIYVRQYKYYWERIIMTPIHIWIVEIIEGNILICIFNKNIAWNYYSKDVAFNKTIKFSYFIPWLILGSVLEFIWIPYIIPAYKLINQYTFYIIPVSVCMTYYTNKYMKFPLLYLK